MHGGIVIEVCKHPTDRHILYVNCIDAMFNRQAESAIYIENNANSDNIQIGDLMWWQGNYAYWTPQANRCKREGKGVQYDIEIPQIGSGGVAHPYCGTDMYSNDKKD